MTLIETAVQIDQGEDVSIGALPDPQPRLLDWIDSAPERNKQRGLLAAHGIKEFAKRVGMLDEDVETVISDLLSDIRHLCDSLDLNFEGMDERGFRHYTDEIHGEG